MRSVSTLGGRSTRLAATGSPAPPGPSAPRPPPTSTSRRSSRGKRRAGPRKLPPPLPRPGAAGEGVEGAGAPLVRVVEAIPGAGAKAGAVAGVALEEGASPAAGPGRARVAPSMAAAAGVWGCALLSPARARSLPGLPPFQLGRTPQAPVHVRSRAPQGRRTSEGQVLVLHPLGHHRRPRRARHRRHGRHRHGRHRHGRRWRRKHRKCRRLLPGAPPRHCRSIPGLPRNKPSPKRAAVGGDGGTGGKGGGAAHRRILHRGVPSREAEPSGRRWRRRCGRRWRNVCFPDQAPPLMEPRLVPRKNRA
jgi:hypothetical protein